MPLDLKLPDLEDAQTAKEREYERRTYQPLIKKTREAAAKFSKLLTRLDDAQRNHPTEEIRRQQHMWMWASASATVPDKAEPPLEKSFDARQIGRALGCDRLCRECLRVVGTIRPRKKGDRSKTEDVLAATGLGSTQIARVTTLLGMEAPAATIEEIAERVRKRLERKRANRT